MWKRKENKRENTITDDFTELLDAWMDLLNVSMPLANMGDWIEVPTKMARKNNPMSYEERDNFIVFTIDMPGVQKKDIDINIEGHSIRVTAENGNGRNYNYTRRFKPTVDENSATATFTNGVLDIQVKKMEEAKKGKQVKIK
jgi:HSP20 family protein